MEEQPATTKAAWHPKLTVLSYLYNPDLGSEDGLGPSAVNMIQASKLRIIVERSQLSNIDGRQRLFHGFPLVVKKKSGRSEIFLGVGAKTSAKSANEHRAHYQVWLWSAWLASRRMKLKGVFWHVCFAQVVGLNPWLVSHRNSLLFGPVGGRAPVYQYSWTPLFARIRSFILEKMIYRMMRPLLRGNKVVFAHPRLERHFQGGHPPSGATIMPAIAYYPQTQNPDALSFPDRKQILFVGRRISTKNPDLTFKVFQTLARQNPNYNFLIVGPGWEDACIAGNFSTMSRQEPERIAALMRMSRLFIFLSFELAGEVCLQSASAKCPTYCFSGFGADFLLTPSPEFLCNPRFRNIESGIDRLVTQISPLISNDDMLRFEGEKQSIAASRWSLPTKARIVSARLKELEPK